MKNTNLRYININRVLIPFIPQMQQYKTILIINTYPEICLQCRVFIRWLWVLYFLADHCGEYAF